MDIITALSVFKALMGIEVTRNLLIWSAASVAALYVLFVIIMHYKHKRDREGGLEWYEWLVVGPALIVGYPLDVIVNFTVATVLFLDPPSIKHGTVSARIDHYLDTNKWKSGYRRKLTHKIAKLLNRVDPGHVGP